MSEVVRDLASIGTMTEALELCWMGSGVPAKVMADRLGIDYGHFTRMFREHDRRHFPPDLIVALMRESGSVLPLEWLAAQLGYALHAQSLRSILEAIRDAMVVSGKDAPRFTIKESGRVEVDHG